MLILEELKLGQTPTRWHAMPVVVPETLEDLHGPAEGVVNLPIWLDWGTHPTYDLSRRDHVIGMYHAVISEATDDADVNSWLNAGLLRAVWRELNLGPRYRRLWEERFPELAGDGAD
jgi:hypothetical protein